MEEECSRSSKTTEDKAPNSEIGELNKTSWENTGGRESSLYRWSSFTETSIQFAESDSSRNTSTDGCSSNQGEESKDKSFPAWHSSTATLGIDGTNTESYRDEHHEGYSEDEFELFEESNETEDSGGELRDEFLEKKLHILNSKKIVCAPANVEKTRKTLVEPEVPMEYYRNKIHLLKTKKQTCGKVKHKQEISVECLKIKDEVQQLENARNIDRLKVNNMLLKIKKENAIPVHQPRKCKKCRKLQGKLAEESYIREKTEKLKKQEIEEKIEKHLYEKDSATLIAEIIRSGPKPSDPPQEIWNRLLRKGEYS